MIWLLFLYFVAASAGLALVFLPGFRSAALGRWRRGTVRLSLWVAKVIQAGHRGVASATGGGQRLSGAVLRWAFRHVWWGLGALVVLVVVPALAVGWRHWNQIDTFDHTDVRIKDDRVAALLAGERLTPPAPLPPDVFTTREVELARPAVRFASRDWDLLDAEFAQRLLMVYRIMQVEHGYEMVLIEGFRSPQRQAQLASMGEHVTKAGAFRSYHQFGLAADSAFMRMGKLVISERDPWAMRGYELYGEVSESMGLTWGGGWRNLKDYGHVELRRPGVLRRAAQEAQPTTGYAQ
jgi:peptidoglycan L-alanyl-D-glutamate endopeptidase CwlK